MVKIKNEKEFKEMFGISPKELYLKGLDEFEKVYSNSRDVYEFAENLLKYLGVEQPTEEQYKSAYVVAVMIESLIRIVDRWIKPPVAEEMFYV